MHGQMTVSVCAYRNSTNSMICERLCIAVGLPFHKLKVDLALVLFYIFLIVSSSTRLMRESIDCSMPTDLCLPLKLTENNKKPEFIKRSLYFVHLNIFLTFCTWPKMDRFMFVLFLIHFFREAQKVQLKTKKKYEFTNISWK